jgi:hypothetical protein
MEQSVSASAGESFAEEWVREGEESAGNGRFAERACSPGGETGEDCPDAEGGCEYASHPSRTIAAAGILDNSFLNELATEVLCACPKGLTGFEKPANAPREDELLGERIEASSSRVPEREK